MRNGSRRAQFGMVLIEAMVALIVMAVGILGIAKLNTFFIEVSGQAKARTQAVQLAEGKLEELRSLMVRAQFDAINNGSDSVYGMSGSSASTAFSRTWGVTKTDDRAVVLVTVSWTDRTNAPQTVEVRSVVSWDDPGKALALVTPASVAGSYAGVPTGRARLGDGTMAVDGSITSNDDGLRQQQGEDGNWRLVDDATGNVLLTATKADERFSEVAGYVYIDQASLSSLRNEDVYIVISDASYCSMMPAKNPAAPSAPQNYGDGSVYKRFSYRCYLGANWFGNIGVIRTDSANTNDRVCLGDPAVAVVAANVKSDNRHPALGTSRMYRGYVAAGTSYKSTGIGVQSSDSSNYTPAVYDGHDFLLTRITGNPVNSDCFAKLTRYDNTNPYHPFSTDAQTHTPPTETAYLNGGNSIVLGNPGRFFCFTTSCPDPLPDGSVPEITITITGTIARSPSTGQRPSVTSMNTNSGTCTVTAGNTAYTYSCSFTGTGFTGSSWSGSISVNTDSGAYVCHTGVSGTVSPMPSTPTSPVQNGYTFQFSDQPVDAGDKTFNFKIGKTATDC